MANIKYILVGLAMLALGGLTPIRILNTVPLGFVFSMGLIFFGVFTIIVGIIK